MYTATVSTREHASVDSARREKEEAVVYLVLSVGKVPVFVYSILGQSFYFGGGHKTGM